jgi:AraC-like DNA-binding protein
MPAGTRRFDLLGSPPRVALANFYPFASGERVERQASESNLFVLVTSGSGRIEVGPEWFALYTGTILHVPWDAAVLYQADVRDPFVVACLHFVYQPWPAPNARFPTHRRGREHEPRAAAPTPQPFDKAFVLSSPPDAQLFELATKIVRAYELPEEPSAVLREAALRGLSLQFVSAFLALAHGQEPRAQAATATEGRIVHEIASYLQFALAEPHTRTALAKRAGVSEAGLSRAFRAMLGKGPIDYLIDLRLAKAKELLATSRVRVGEAAAQVGIADIYHFSKLFKKRLGYAPLEYRRRHRL